LLLLMPQHSAAFNALSVLHLLPSNCWNCMLWHQLLPTQGPNPARLLAAAAANTGGMNLLSCWLLPTPGHEPAQLLAAAAASTAAPKLEPSAVGLNWISRVSSLAREPRGSTHAAGNQQQPVSMGCGSCGNIGINEDQVTAAAA
jgi:hypothetical protein